MELQEKNKQHSINIRYQLSCISLHADRYNRDAECLPTPHLGAGGFLVEGLFLGHVHSFLSDAAESCLALEGNKG